MSKSPDADYLRALADSFHTIRGSGDAHSIRLLMIADKVEQADAEFDVALGQVIDAISGKVLADAEHEG